MKIKNIEVDGTEAGRRLAIEVFQACGEPIERLKNNYNLVTDLLHDLNAVHELEMAYIQVKGGKEKLFGVDARGLMITPPFDHYFAPAHIRFEALASVLEVECDKCMGDAYDCPFKTVGGCCSAPIDIDCACTTCNGTGKRKLIDVWYEQFREVV